MGEPIVESRVAGEPIIESRVVGEPLKQVGKYLYKYQGTPNNVTAPPFLHFTTSAIVCLGHGGGEDRPLP